MPDINSIPGQEPAEGSRETVDRELGKIPQNDNGSGAIKKPDTPSDGPRGGEINTHAIKPAV